MKKKVIAVILYVALLMTSVFPATALADGDSQGGTEQEAPVCTCESKCAQGAVNGLCPVCSAEGADFSACKGPEPQPMNEQGGGDTTPADGQGGSAPDGQGDGGSTPTPAPTVLICTCTVKCSEGAEDTACPVCGAEGADLSACTGQTAESGENENDGTPAPAPSPVCTCTAKCAEGAVNADCPVCAADWNSCVFTGENGEPEEDNKPETVTVTDWAWVDEQTVLAPDGKLYLPSAVTAESLEGIKALLPQNITAAGQSIGPLTWTYDEATGIFTAALPEGYALAEGAKPLTIETVDMGAGTLDEEIVKYIDENGVEQNVTATLVTANDTHWEDTVTNGWYVVKGDITIGSRITVTGSVKLILADGCSLTVNGGIGVNGSNSFTIYGQTDGTGSLDADATTSSLSAGIGSNMGSSGGTITINGGTVTATASGGGAAIGDGFSAGGSSIIINGGTVKADVTDSAAAIGSSSNGGNSSITINGGTVTATASGGSAAIGDGLYGGGSTFSTGSNGTAIIYATGDSGAAAISDQSGKTAGAWSGIIFEGDAGAVYGNQTNSGSFTIATGQTLEILSGSSFTNSGTLTIDGGLTNNGIFNNNGPVTVPMAGSFTNIGTLNCTYHSYGNGECVICGTKLVLVTGIQLNPGSLNLSVGSTATLQATVSPDNAANKTLTWSSNAPGVATVDLNTGVVTAVSAGTAVITATAADGSNVKAECTVTVYPAVTRVDISNTGLSLHKGESHTLSATVYPEGALQTLSWSSSAPDIVSVDKDGKVTAVSAGTAIITATATDGSGVKAECAVTVKIPVASVTMSRSSLRIYEGRGYTLSAAVSPADAADKSLYWSSSDDSIASVDQDGKVTGHKPGVCTIYAQAQDGSGAYASCVVRVLRWYPGATPITGDSSNLVLWIGLLGASLVAAGAAAFILIKKRKKK